MEDLQNISNGTARDELSWIDVQEHSVKILNQQGKYLFITPLEAMEHSGMIDKAKSSDHEIIIIPENLKQKIQGAKDSSGDPITDIDQFFASYYDSYEFTFVDIRTLTDQEKAIYYFTPKIVKLFGGLPGTVQSIKISSTMRKDIFSNVETLGCWDRKSNLIIMSRKSLKSLNVYSGTLIHELIHAKTGHCDVTRDFEIALTDNIGNLCQQLLVN
ncbi:hypothetical protein [Candidatus Symbiobacter mobilis]|uniref:Uncharacterized protein n=1 Tax=Candidatus Symbiobacter mobilis CR TaxID=946483 RepID=U5NBP5_9BURK|nr:hypothetical protein [Candidatus Symbiobacter mobilis]AGX87663.1 hypothetical protein Cenrod_1578 [Candidatus Symbiobacter mobilis CR]